MLSTLPASWQYAWNKGNKPTCPGAWASSVIWNAPNVSSTMPGSLRSINVVPILLSPPFLLVLSSGHVRFPVTPALALGLTGPWVWLLSANDHDHHHPPGTCSQLAIWWEALSDQSRNLGEKFFRDLEESARYKWAFSIHNVSWNDLISNHLGRNRCDLKMHISNRLTKV